MWLMPAMIGGYMVLLVGLAVAAPGIGLIGSLMVLFPHAWLDAAHVPAYGLLAWLAIQGFRLRGWPLPYALLGGVLLSTMFGLWTEVAQGSAPGREASWHDLMSDLIGGLLAAGLVYGQGRGTTGAAVFTSTHSLACRRMAKGTATR